MRQTRDIDNVVVCDAGSCRYNERKRCSILGITGVDDKISLDADGRCESFVPEINTKQ